MFAVYLKQELLFLVVRFFGRPSQKLGDVLGELTGGSSRAVRVLDDIVVERLGHGNPAAVEIRIVVQALFRLDASRRIMIAR